MNMPICFALGSKFKFLAPTMNEIGTSKYVEKAKTNMSNLIIRWT